MELSKDTFKVIMLEAINTVRAEIDKDMPISALQILLIIPERGTISFREVEKLSGLSHATTSRGLALLGGFSSSRLSTSDPLIAHTTDLVDRRFKYASLTKLGAEKVNRVHQAVNERISNFN